MNGLGVNFKDPWQLDYDLPLAPIKEKQALKHILGIIPGEKFILKMLPFNKRKLQMKIFIVCPTHEFFFQWLSNNIKSSKVYNFSDFRTILKRSISTHPPIKI